MLEVEDRMNQLKSIAMSAIYTRYEAIYRAPMFFYHHVVQEIVNCGRTIGM